MRETGDGVSFPRKRESRLVPAELVLVQAGSIFKNVIPAEAGIHCPIRFSCDKLIYGISECILWTKVELGNEK